MSKRRIEKCVCGKRFATESALKMHLKAKRCDVVQKATSAEKKSGNWAVRLLKRLF